MDKIINIGKIDVYGNGRKSNIFCHIQTKSTDKGLTLSITGVVGPRSNGNAAGSCGQIIMDYKEYHHNGHASIADITPAPGWDYDMIRKFFDIWQRWHLNDLRAGCEHQEAAIKDRDLRNKALYPMSLYELILSDFHNIYHCDICDYNYGSAWNTEQLPVGVLHFLKNLPDTTITPAWV